MRKGGAHCFPFFLFCAMIIALHMPVWRRVKLTRAVYHGLKRNIREFAEHGVQLIPYIGVSEQEHEDLAMEFGFKVCWVTNRTLGEKNQALFEIMKRDNWDWMLQLGSDDFLLPGGAEVILANMRTSEFSAFVNLYFFNAESRKGWELRGYRCGAGRFMSRNICDRVTMMWNNRKKGLDGYSQNKVFEITGIHVQNMEGTYIADIKTEVNVTPYFVNEVDNLQLDEIVPEAYLI